MGLLDEAIKQHLELKRRRGADPTEIERLEREALGPVRRIAHEVPAEDSAPHPRGTEPEVGEEELHDRRAYEEGEDFLDDPRYEYLPEDDAEYSEEEPGRFQEEGSYASDPGRPFTEHPDPVAASGDVRHPGASEPPPVSEDVGVETAEYDVEAAHADAGEGEDVLEETPEFLQDTPDHDRLWFEQRPPRDFDFDG